jgi:hypothetical protein
MPKESALFAREDVFIKILSKPLAYYKNTYASMSLYLSQHSPLAEPIHYQIIKKGAHSFVFFAQKPFAHASGNTLISTLACTLYAQGEQSYVLFVGKNFLELTELKKSVLINSILLSTSSSIQDNIQRHCQPNTPLTIVYESELVESLTYKQVSLYSIAHHKITVGNTLPSLHIKYIHIFLGFFILLAGYIKISLWEEKLKIHKTQLDNQVKRANQYQQLMNEIQNATNHQQMNSTSLLAVDVYPFLYHLHQSMSIPIQIHKIHIKENRFVIEAVLENPFTLMEQLLESAYLQDISIEYVQVKEQDEYFRITGEYHAH